MKRNAIATKLVLVSPHINRDQRKQEKKEKVGHIIGLVVIYAFLVVAAILAVFPFYYMIAASMMSRADIDSGKLFVNVATMIDNIAYNYSNTFVRLDYFHHVGITLAVAITTTILQLLTTILAAFAFARLTFRGRDILFILFLATMMVPGELLAITNFSTLSNMGLTGLDQNFGQAFLAMVMPLISSSFYIYLLRQNFKQIPDQLYLAAKSDGKSDWGFLWKVMVPLSSPTIITITILSLIGTWNNYVWPSLVVENLDNALISVIIRKGALTELGIDGLPIIQYGWQMAASVLTVVPLLILFIIFRKYIMSGTGKAGIKG